MYTMVVVLGRIIYTYMHKTVKFYLRCSSCPARIHIILSVAIYIYIILYKLHNIRVLSVHFDGSEYEGVRIS